LPLPISKELEEKSFSFLESLLIVFDFELRKNANHSKLLNQKSDTPKDFAQRFYASQGNAPSRLDLSAYRNEKK
jgi:hypothetical protein